MKLFSLIIPTYNEAQGIYPFLQALQNLKEQCELIIADGGSHDKTCELTLPFVDKVIYSPKGRAIQMNAGAAVSKGEILIFLHADTFLPKNALQCIKKGIDCGAQWGRFDMQLVGKPIMLKVISQMMNWRSRLTGIATGDQVIFVTRQLFEQLGGYPTIALMEDIALSRQLNAIAPPLCLTEKVQSSGRRWEIFGVWRTIFLMWIIRLRYFMGEQPEVLAQLYQQGKFFKQDN